MTIALTTSLDKYRNIEVFAHNFLCSQDPFAMTCTSSSTTTTLSTTTTSSTAATSSTTAISSTTTVSSLSGCSTLFPPAGTSSSATQHSPGWDFQRAVHRHAKRCGAGKFLFFFILAYIILNFYYMFASITP